MSMRKGLALAVTLAFLPATHAWAQDAALVSAAQRGDVAAEGKLSDYYYGIKDYTHAFFWIQKAAAGGDSEAVMILGFMYEEGKGVSRDYVKAAQWYRKAADAGNASAAVDLGYLI